MTSAAAVRRAALLAPMRQELRPLVRPLSLRRSRGHSGPSQPPGSVPEQRAGGERSRSGADSLFAGALGEVEIVAMITGIGTRAAARAAERVLDSGAVDHLVVVGIAGGIGPSVEIGDLVLPELVIDLATGSEHRPARLAETAPRGTLVTSDGLIVDREEFARLERRGVIAIDMETAAIAAVCERRRCPWSVFRAISDRAGDPAVDSDVFGLAGPDGGVDLPALARFLLTRPWRIRDLARLGRGMRLATRVAASASVDALAGVGARKLEPARAE